MDRFSEWDTQNYNSIKVMRGCVISWCIIKYETRISSAFRRGSEASMARGSPAIGQINSRRLIDQELIEQSGNPYEWDQIHNTGAFMNMGLIPIVRLNQIFLHHWRNRRNASKLILNQNLVVFSIEASVKGFQNDLITYFLIEKVLY